RLREKTSGSDPHGRGPPSMVSREYDDGNVPVCVAGSEDLREGGPVHSRHPEIEEDEARRTTGGDHLQGLLPVGPSDRFMSVLGEQQDDEIADVGVVVHDQDPPLVHRALRSLGRMTRNVVPSPGALSSRISPPNAPTMVRQM